MKKFKKIFAVLLALLTIVSLIGINKTYAARDNKTTTVHITKLKSDSTPKAIKHDGTKIEDLSKLKDSLGVTVTPLAGVEFTYYSVKDQATLDEMMKEPGKYTTDAEVKGKLGQDVQGTKTGKTAENTGLVDVTLSDGLYWFIETDKPETVSSAVAVPFGISLPMTQPDGKAEMSDVYIYPKNVESNLPEPDKTVGNLTNKEESYDIGKDLKWFLQSNVPTNIKDYTKFEFQDTLDSKLDYVGNVVVKYGEDVVPMEGNYTVQEPSDTNQRLFKVEFTKNSDGKLKYFADLDQSKIDANKEGKKLVVEYTTKINKTAVMGQKIENNVKLVFNNDPKSTVDKDKTPTTPPTVVTGGKKFKKTDGATALKDAQFVVQNTVSGKTTYLKVDDQTGAVTWVDTKEAATTYTTGDDGIIDVKGLTFTKAQQAGTEVTNKYELVEIKAPEGFAILVETIGFTVDKDSYGDAQNVLQEVVNKKLTIPQTGGVGTVIYGVIGLVVMGGAVFMMRRRGEK